MVMVQALVTVGTIFILAVGLLAGVGCVNNLIDHWLEVGTVAMLPSTAAIILLYNSGTITWSRSHGEPNHCPCFCACGYVHDQGEIGDIDLHSCSGFLRHALLNSLQEDPCPLNFVFLRQKCKYKIDTNAGAKANLSARP